MVFSSIEFSRTSRASGALLCAVVSEVCATLALKKALEVPEYYTVVLIGYALSFVFLSLVLRLGMALGVAYGIWGALGVALTSVLSVVLFGEPINITAVVGISFIVLGVLLVELGSQSHSASGGRDSTE